MVGKSLGGGRAMAFDGATEDVTASMAVRALLALTPAWPRWSSWSARSVRLCCAPVATFRPQRIVTSKDRLVGVRSMHEHNERDRAAS